MVQYTGDNDDTVVRARPPQSGTRATEPDLTDTIIRLREPRATAPTALTALSALGGLSGLTDALTPRLETSQLNTPRQSVGLWAMRVRGTTTIVPLDVPAVVGRRPSPLRPTEYPAPRQVVIPADRGEVSARHVRVEQLGETLVVVDLGSTNGTVVHWSSGSRVRLRHSESCAVLPDAIIALGDGVEIEFVAVEALTGNTPDIPRPSEHS